MARRASPILGFFGKWVCVPAGLAALGYFVVGPKFGDRVPQTIKANVDTQITALNSRVHNIVTPTASGHATPPKPSTPPAEANAAPKPGEADNVTSEGGPEVEVSVRSGGRHREHHFRRRSETDTPVHHKVRHRKPKPKPVPVDEGSYGGTEDQGSTTGAGGPPAGG